MTSVFDFNVPKGYSWLIENKIIGFEPFTPLAPWYLLNSSETFRLEDFWDKRDRKDISFPVFARRQDCDDLACFEVLNGEVLKVLVVHGWTHDGYDVLLEFENFWDWIKLVIDDISELLDSESD